MQSGTGGHATGGGLASRAEVAWEAAPASQRRGRRRRWAGRRRQERVGERGEERNDYIVIQWLCCLLAQILKAVERSMKNTVDRKLIERPEARIFVSTQACDVLGALGQVDGSMGSTGHWHGMLKTQLKP